MRMNITSTGAILPHKKRIINCNSHKYTNSKNKSQIILAFLRRPEYYYFIFMHHIEFLV